jgi:hypothetical protein
MIFYRIAEMLVEPHNGAVVSTNLEIELRAAKRSKSVFCRLHESTTEPEVPLIGMDRQMIHPSAKAIVPSEDSPHDAAPEATDEEEFPLRGQLPANDQRRLVARRVVWKHQVPEVGDSYLIRLSELTNLEFLLAARLLDGHYAPPDG